MVRTISILSVPLALALLAPVAGAARQASPIASPGAGGLASSAVGAGRTDLAAAALTAADLPPGFVNVDERYFLDTGGVATFYASGGVSPDEVESLGLRAMYDGFYQGPDEQFIYLYVAEFGSAAAVEAGFHLLEDERRVVGDAGQLLANRDLPGPGIGDAPSETTVAVLDYRALGGPVVDQTGVAFRVGNALVGVILETPTAGSDAGGATPAVATPAAPDPVALRLVEDAASTLAARLREVQAGEVPSGVDAALPPLLLPLDQVWPRPGVAAEGYKDAAQILGSVGPAAGFRDQFRGAYSRTVAPGTGADDPFPEPPFVTVGVSTFASSEAALGVLAAGDLPVPGPLPPSGAQEPVADPEVPGADASTASRSAFEPGRPADSARVALVVGDRLVTVDVQGAASEEAALAAARDLAAQQAACLGAVGACTALVPPATLAADGSASPTDATPTP